MSCNARKDVFKCQRTESCDRCFQECAPDLLEALKGLSQCFKCKYGYKSNLDCPGEADGEIPCTGFIEEHPGNYSVEAVIAKATKN